MEIRNFDINNYGGIQNYGLSREKKYIIADDNLLTAKTMQLALNTFYDIGIDVNSIVIVRYPSVNRVDQMFLENHGAVDYKYFSIIYMDYVFKVHILGGMKILKTYIKIH